MSTPPHDPPDGEPQRYGPPPPPAESRNGCALPAMFAGGLAGYLVLNLVVALIAFPTGEALGSEGAGFAVGAVLLAALSLGTGVLCLIKGSRMVKALGMGLIFGWSALSVVTLGYCTGLNPSMYGGSF